MAVTSSVSVTFSPAVVVGLTSVTLRDTPLLSNVVLTQGLTTLDATIDTDQATGTLYYSVRADTTPVDLMLESSVAVSGTTITIPQVTGLAQGTTYYFHYQQVNAAGWPSAYGTQSFITDLNVGTTPKKVLVLDPTDTLVIVSGAITTGDSIFAQGTGSVADGDKLVWRTVSGDSSGLAINADGSWSFSSLPGADVVIDVRVYDVSTETMGAAGQITFSVAGETLTLEGVILRPQALSVVTLPTDLYKNSSASITLDNLTVTPTNVNTRIFLVDENGPELTSFSVVQNTATRFTFNVTPDVLYAYGDYPLLIVSDKQFITTATVHYQPPIGWGYVNVTTPVTDQPWSVFYNYTGDAPTDGQLEWYETTSEAGITVRVQGDGSVVFTYTDTNNTTDVVISDRIILEVRHIDSALNVGAWGTFTYLATQMVTATFDSAWHSDMYVANTFASDWDVYNEASQTFDSAWDLYNIAMRTFDDAWDISQYVRQDFQSTWLFAGTVRAEFVSEWHVEEALPEMVTVQFPSRWNMEAAGGPLTVAFESAWDIERTVTATFPSRWNSEAATVGSDVGNDLTHRMIIVGEDRVMKIG